jgi:hypothetical protein
MSVYVDADDEYDLVIRRSITGIILMLNNTLIWWISKRQKTVETSTYGSGLMGSRTSTELIHVHVELIGFGFRWTNFHVWR